jgi:hypothetical protein
MRPSRIASCPSFALFVMSPRLTTAGISSERARIAQCAVRVPPSVAIPSTFSGSRWTVRLGVRFEATTMTPSSSRARSVGS